MSVERLRGIPGFAIDKVAAAAGSDPEVLRLENLDMDLPPPSAAVEATRAAVGRDDDNSYLPFIGQTALREAVADRLRRTTGHGYDASHVVITAGGTEGLFDALLATTDRGDEVLLTDPTYAGMIYRVRLAGAVPRLVPFVLKDGAWRLDLEALRAAVTPRTRVVFLMNPSMPSGAVLNEEEWQAVADLCAQHHLWLIYNAAMERIVFDGRTVLHPCRFPGLAERTLVVGSVSKEYRMIGWRIGWVAGPQAVVNDVARVHIYNVVTPPGIAQAGAVAAFAEPEEAFQQCLATWQRRRDVVNEQLRDWPIVSAAGGWSLLLDVRQLGLDSFTASRLLLEKGRVAATPMRDWGERNGDAFVRLVFSNEPEARLRTLRERVEQTF